MFQYSPYLIHRARAITATLTSEMAMMRLDLVT